MDYKLEVIVIPVSDIDAAKEFYEKKMGFTLDHDTDISEDMRIVQLTPPWLRMLDRDGQGHPADGAG